MTEINWKEDPRIGALTVEHVANMGIPEPAAQAYYLKLVEHIRYVIEAGGIIGLALPAVELHDHSKFSMIEFPAYALHFFVKKSPAVFAPAWLHHIHQNDHHWQYWQFSDGYNPEGANIVNGCLPMPETAVSEMIADWLGASRAHRGSWDLSPWLKEAGPAITLHPETAVSVRGWLADLEYPPEICNLIKINGDGGNVGEA